MQRHVLMGNLGRTCAERGTQSPDTRVVADAKTFSTLAAEFALAGYELIDEVGIDDARRLYTVRDGKTQRLDSLDAARALLAQIGGSP